MKHIFFYITLVFIACISNINAQGTDLRWLDKINSPINSTTDGAWQFISNSINVVGFGAPLSIFIVGVTTHNKDLKLKSYKTGISLLLAGTLSTALKITIQRPRPFATYPNIIYKKGEAGSYSFPSGHTNFAFATATSLSLAFPKWYIVVPAYAYAAAVGYSRMYLGVHYPSDVLVGALIGIGSSFLTFHAQKWIHKNKETKSPE